MPGTNSRIRLNVLMKYGQAGLDAYRLRQAKKRQRMRYVKRFREKNGHPPTSRDELRAMRKYMRGHPMSCCCFDCTYEPEEEAALRAPPIRQCRAAASLLP